MVHQARETRQIARMHQRIVDKVAVNNKNRLKQIGPFKYTLRAKYLTNIMKIESNFSLTQISISGPQTQDLRVISPTL